MLNSSIKRIQYNSPVILTFSLLAVAVHLMNLLIPRFTMSFFVLNPHMSLFSPLDYFRMCSYVLGHANWEHLFSNLTFILLLGPILEEKYGSKNMLIMILLTALSTALISGLIFRTAVLGASGIVFMLIVLASIVDVRAGSIPLTFVLVVGIFIGRELLQGFRADNISQLGHIAGGAAGAFFGFSFTKPLRR
jgi:membrane associated rhomboid family serine protease